MSRDNARGRFVEPMQFAFDAGWDAALEEAILILETAEHQDRSLLEAIADVRQFRDEK